MNVREIVLTTIRQCRHKYWRTDAADRVISEVAAWQYSRRYPATTEQLISRIATALQNEQINPECYPPLDMWAAGWEYAYANAV